MSEPRVIVFAYHDVGYACLEVLLRRGVNVAAVFTHDDDADENIWFKSVTALAREHDVPVHTPERVNTPEWSARIRALAPDLIFSFYYRNMIAPEILQTALLGAYNMHGSLLPKYRGRAPVNWAVLHGESQIGATLHVMVKRPDAGDIVDQQAVPIGAEDTAQQVFDRVTHAACDVLERQLDALLVGRAPRHKQDESQATYFGRRTPDDGRIAWSDDARTIFNLVRAVTHPYPGAFTEMDGRRLFVWWGKVRDSVAGQPGEVVSTAPLRVAAGRGGLEVLEWQWEGDAVSRRGDDHGLRAGQRFNHANHLTKESH